MPILVTHSPHKPPRIEGEARGYGPEIAGEGARVLIDGAKLTLETDQFATHPLHVLVRDGQLWAADSLHRLTRMPGVPKGLLPMGICTAICNAPARRPSLCASGLSLLPATRTVSEAGKIHTTALGLPDRASDPVEPGFAAAVERRASLEPQVLFDGPFAQTILKFLGNERKRAWIMARSGVDVATLATHAQQMDADAEIVTVPEEDLPALADDAIRACETLISDSAPVAYFAFFKQVRVARMLSPLGGAELWSEEGLLPHKGVPEFIARLQPECDLAHFLLRPDWAKRIQRQDWHKEAQVAHELRIRKPQLDQVTEELALIAHSRELFLRTLLPHHKLPERVLTACAHGVELQMPYLDRNVVALRGLPFEGRGPDFTGRSTWDVATFGNQTPVLSSLARRNWILWLDARLSFDRLERLEVIDSGKVRRELIQYGKLHTEAPRRVLLERVFFKLASLTVLQEHWS